ncbi:bZIP transcription factor 16 isoform X3 [Helianthus annuus]|uniref:bZIP transcription factor 16 isoform X3 n=1 Tax=Helianthus annuus TaxID=4232 RepID=UPI000B90A3A7|nr:bZIP transcription factor 16 isoform X3 [Helianthus annuus]
MASQENDGSPVKEANDSANETQEQPSGNAMGAVPPDWTGFQAYSPMPPPGYLASSPQPPPYMWGVQGSYPFSPYAMPSPNGVAEASVNTAGSMEVNGKSPEGKEKLPIKRSKGSLGSLNMITGINNESSKNGSYPKSGESGSEGSSEGSDANSENNSQMKSGPTQDSMEDEASQNGNSTVNGYQNGGLVNQTMMIVPMSAAGGMVAAVGSRENMQPQHWLQDERELKRQRRKQSNRESARRSRLRKQAECDELAQRAETLTEENAALKTEVSRIRSDYEQLLAENAVLKERLAEAPGQEETNQEMGRGNHQDGQALLV